LWRSILFLSRCFQAWIKEDRVAEEKAKAPEATAPAKAAGQKPILLIVLVVVNMMVVLGVGFMVWKSKQTPPPTIDQIVAGEKQQVEHDKAATEEVGKVIPLETFIVNLANSKGRKVLKVNMELEVAGTDIVQEIDNRKAQIRDFIIIILSVKTYEQISTKEGKDDLRTEIKDKVNSFLSKGKITNVYFTELIYN
jgi:flagellar protein FliL